MLERKISDLYRRPAFVPSVCSLLIALVIVTGLLVNGGDVVASLSYIPTWFVVPLCLFTIFFRGVFIGRAKADMG